MGRTKPAFGAFLARLGSTLMERSERYGTKNVDAQSVLARLRDKMARLEYAAARGLSAPDDLLDIAGHAACGWLLEQGFWDGRSALRKVYYAHPAGDDPPTWDKLYDEVHGWLLKKFAVFRPVTAFGGALDGHQDWIWETNLRNIELADMLVAVLPHTSAGVCAELLFAKQHGKVVWTLASYDAIGSLVRYASDRLFVTTGALQTAIEEVKPVEIPKDTAQEAAKTPLGI